MIRKIYEVDPLRCPRCGGEMKIVSFLTEPAVVDRIIDHLKLVFVAERPLRPFFRSSFGRLALPTLRPASFPILRPNMFRDRRRAHGEWCVRTTASRTPEPAAFAGTDGFLALPAVIDTA